jgi:hypothetical protein
VCQGDTFQELQTAYPGLLRWVNAALVAAYRTRARQLLAKKVDPATILDTFKSGKWRPTGKPPGAAGAALVDKNQGLPPEDRAAIEASLVAAKKAISRLGGLDRALAAIEALRQFDH